MASGLGLGNRIGADNVQQDNLDIRIVALVAEPPEPNRLGVIVQDTTDENANALLLPMGVVVGSLTQAIGEMEKRGQLDDASELLKFEAVQLRGLAAVLELASTDPERARTGVNPPENNALVRAAMEAEVARVGGEVPPLKAKPPRNAEEIKEIERLRDAGAKQTQIKMADFEILMGHIVSGESNMIVTVDNSPDGFRSAVNLSMLIEHACNACKTFSEQAAIQPQVAGMFTHVSNELGQQAYNLYTTIQLLNAVETDEPPN